MLVVKKIKVFVLILSSLFIAIGCTKNFEELNTNPALLSEEIVTP